LSGLVARKLSGRDSGANSEVPIFVKKNLCLTTSPDADLGVTSASEVLKTEDALRTKDEAEGRPQA